MEYRGLFILKEGHLAKRAARYLESGSFAKRIVRRFERKESPFGLSFFCAVGSCNEVLWHNKTEYGGV